MTTNKPDVDVLELAAKAAGYKIYKNESKRDGILIFKEGRQQFLEEDGSPISLWNPLTDDGDALRLAVKVGMLIDVRYNNPESAKYNRVLYWIDPSKASEIGFSDDQDICAATRRAITRAAAEIGRAMYDKQ